MTQPSRDAPPFRSSPRAGDIIGGKYRVERTIGRGGMGMVVEASHLVLRERVALKFLLPSLAQREDLVARFLREAQAAVRIKSEHVARVMDVGRLESGAPYMVMELLSGRDLGRMVKDQGPLPLEEAVEYIAQACDAIAEAHSIGIVHRDLKPSNLFVTKRADGSPLLKVLDFGISKLMADATRELGALPGDDDGVSDASLTSASDVLGSPLYMAPEQIRTPKAVDGRADIWALGAILHKLITGKAIFAAETPPAILAAVIADAPRRLRDEIPTAPPELEAILLRCLEKDPALRFPTALDLAVALLPFLPETSRAWRRTSSSHPNAASFLATGSQFRPVLVTGSTPPPMATTFQPPPAPNITGSGFPAAEPGTMPPARASRDRIVALMAVAAALTIAGGSAALLLHAPSKAESAHARRGIATGALMVAAQIDRAALFPPPAPPPSAPPVASEEPLPPTTKAKPASTNSGNHPTRPEDTLDDRH